MKLKEVLNNIAVTIFMWLLAGACILSLFTHAVQTGDKAQIAVLILLAIDAVFLFLRYKK